jgi:hypothetical protein
VRSVSFPAQMKITQQITPKEARHTRLITVGRRESPNEGRAAETNLAPSRYVVMRIREKKSVDPMSIQPGRYVTICPALPLMPTAGEPSETPTSRKRDTRSDAVRVAKAKISRRRSLKKQREAQKAHIT